MLSERTTRWMMDCGYDPDQVNAQGQSDEAPLIKAIRKGMLLVVKELIRSGAEIDVTTQDGHSALWVACSAESQPIADLLLKEGLDINYQNEEGMTVLMYAATSARSTWIEFLLDHGADPAMVSADGSTAEDVASTHSVIRLLRRAAKSQLAPADATHAEEIPQSL